MDSELYVMRRLVQGQMVDVRTSIDWLIAGGESGHGHRPCDAAWVQELRNLCQAQQVAFFFKQWGGRTPKVGGRDLDGRTWDDYPAPPLPIAAAERQ